MTTTLAQPEPQVWKDRLNGVLFVALFALAVTQLAGLPFFSSLGISPLVVGIVCGMLYGNFLRGTMSAHWVAGVQFSGKRILRIAVALYGLNISLQQIIDVGLPGIVVSVGVAVGILALGSWIGTRFLHLDRDLSMLTAAGSAICGAAAVLAFESTLRSKPHKSAVAVATVVLFGTISMFLYPILYQVGWFPWEGLGMGLFIGGSVHEVAQVVAAASSIDPLTTEVATIVKMTRVALLVPLLLIIGLWLQRSARRQGHSERAKLPIPWFAIGFLVFALINSANVLAPGVLQTLRALDVFLLTMAMTALGIETRFSQMKAAGPRVLALAAILFVALFVITSTLVWLVV